MSSGAALQLQDMAPRLQPLSAVWRGPTTGEAESSLGQPLDELQWQRSVAAGPEMFLQCPMMARANH